MSDIQTQLNHALSFNNHKQIKLIYDMLQQKNLHDFDLLLDITIPSVIVKLITDFTINEFSNNIFKCPSIINIIEPTLHLLLNLTNLDINEFFKLTIPQFNNTDYFCDFIILCLANELSPSLIFEFVDILDITNQQQYIQCFLLYDGDVNIQDTQGDTLLLKVLQMNFIEWNASFLVNFLIYQNINVNIVNYKQQSAIEMACRSGFRIVMLDLFNAGANINQIVQIDGWEMNLLIYAIVTSRLGMIELLLSQNIDINYQDSFGRTAIFYASTNSSIEVMNMFVEWGANFSIIDNDGNNVLIYYIDNVAIPDHDKIRLLKRLV